MSGQANPVDAAIDCIRWYLEKTKGNTMSKTEPMVKAQRAVYRASNQYKLDQLLAQQTRWLRKRTIAENKLADVRRDIDTLLAKVVSDGGCGHQEKGGAS
jgi:hypothetical protein